MSAFVLITGASRGFGRAFASVTAKKYGANSTYVLTGRSESSLKETANDIKNVTGGDPTIHTVPGDLSDEAGAEALAKKLLSFLDTDKHDTAVIASNAGAVEPQTLLSSENIPLSEVQFSLAVNITSALYLVNQTVRAVEPWRGTDKKCFLLNVSSKAAVQAFKCWGVYCSAKAARNMLFNVAAVEDGENGILRVVNYGPGVLDTDMQKDVRTKVGDEGTKKFFQSLADEGKLIPPAESARKLFWLVTDNKFENGAHIDYWDLDI